MDDLESCFNELAFYVLDDEEILHSVEQNMGNGHIHIANALCGERP